MTKIDINTDRVKIAGCDLRKDKDWNNVWTLLNRLSCQLSGLDWTADTKTREYISSAKEAINKLQWEYLNPITVSIDRLGNICINAADKFEAVDEKWSNHFASTSADNVTTPLSAALNLLKGSLKEPVTDLIKELTKAIGGDLGAFILANAEKICDHVLDALPGFAIDIVAAASGVGMGLLVADLANVIISTIIDISLDDNSASEKNLKQLYSLSGVGVGYNKDHKFWGEHTGGFKPKTVIATYDLRGKDLTSTIGKCSVGKLILDVDSKISSKEYNIGYDYQCFGQQTGQESKDLTRGLAEQQKQAEQAERDAKVEQLLPYPRSVTGLKQSIY